MCVLSVVLVVLTVVLDLLSRQAESPASWLGRYAYLSLALPVSLVGALISAQRPGNRIGAIMMVGGVSVAFDQFAFGYWRCGSARDWPGVHLVGWVGNWVWAIPPATLLFALLLFPDGRLPTRHWLPVAGMIGAWAVLTVGAAALGGGVYNGPPLDPTVVLTGSVGELLRAGMPALFGAFPVLLIMVAVSLLLRFHGARGEQRQQLSWLAYAGALVALVWLIPAVHRVSSWERAAANLLLSVVPVAIGIAILRYRLYEIDRLVNRTIVYAVLTGCVGAIYLTSITLLGAVLEQQSGLAVALLASAVVAIVIAPLRTWLQRAVDRLLYGLRREPFAVMSQLGSRLEAALAPQDVLPSIVDTVGQALKIPYVAIELHRDGRLEPVCVRGASSGEDIEFALVHHGTALGRLVVGPRAPGEPYTAAEQRLLRDLARHAGIAVHAVQLTDDLQRSRERIVSAREEERRRLRRDLHDGLGPTLAGIAFRLEAACQVLPAEPERARALLDDLAGDVKRSIGEIRRVVSGLRPPALDEFGLVGAIRQHIAEIGGAAGAPGTVAGPVAMEVRAPTPLPQLPAAVEVAVYRIAVEALINVFRHSAARHCWLDIRVCGALELEVVDDGRGTGEARPSEGIGMSSMRERAAELGGTCVIESTAPTGTRVFVRLPVS